MKEQLYDVIFKVPVTEFRCYKPCITVKRKDLDIEALEKSVAKHFDVDMEIIELEVVQKRTIPLWRESDLNAIR